MQRSTTNFSASLAADAKSSAAAKDAHAKWWEARIARQREIDASIAAKADTEYLFDKPYEDKKKVRVAGPFTVESLSPHRTLGVDENDELIDTVMERKTGYAIGRDFPSMILENLKTAGVQQAAKADRSSNARSRSPGKSGPSSCIRRSAIWSSVNF